MPKKRPLVFIGSSSEGLQVAKAIQAELQHSAECVIWSQGLFGLSEGTLESLVKALETFDFAILALTPDDLVSSRGETQSCPRDNVLLELGMFIGGLGRERTFMVIDRSAKVKLPSDLAGITPATYQPPDGGTMQSAVGPACTAIEDAIKKLGLRNPELPVKIVVSVFNDLNLGEGLQLTVTNEGNENIPPYRVNIFHPKLGSWYFFPSEKSGPLLPQQKREHKCVLIVAGSIPAWFPGFERDDELYLWTDSDDKDFVLQLVLEDSEKVLYENRRIARALANIFRKSKEHGSKICVDYRDWAELNSSLPDE